MAAKSAGKAADKINTLLILRILLGAFFIILGICGVLQNVDESVFSLGQGKYLTLEIIFGIIEIVCGVILILSILVKGAKSLTSLGSLIILIVWLIRIIITRFVFGLFTFRMTFESFMIWLLILSLELIIAAVLLLLYKRYD